MLWVTIAFRDVIRVPIVRDADPVRGLPALVADLGVRGLWAAQTELHYLIFVSDTDAQSYTSRTVELKMRRKKYLDALRLNMHLSPLLSPQLMVS